MRHSFFTVALLLFSLMLMPRATQAAGNVLLPSDSSSGDLGLSVPSPSVGNAPSDPKPAAAPPASPAGVTANSLKSVTTPSPSMSGIPANSPPLSSTPFPAKGALQSTASPVAMTPAPVIPTITISSPVSADRAAKLPPGTMKTMVIHQPDMSDNYEKAAQAMGTLPYSLTIGLSEKSIFGAKDIKEITGKLGLKEKEVGSSCLLKPVGIVKTDKGTYIVSGKGSSATLHYDGTIQSYLLSAQAMCSVSGDLPPGSGILTEIGDRYRIQLQSITCTVPKRQVTSLTVTYDGSDKSQCDYY